MRKLTLAQIAAMTASLGVFTSTTTRYGIPLMGLATIANATDGEELEEVVVTGTRPQGYDIKLYEPGTSGFPVPPGASGPTPTAPPVAEVKSDAPTALHKNAERCAMRYSVTVSEGVEHAHGGQKPGFVTTFLPGYAWGANNTSINPPFVMSTSKTVPPDAHHSRLIMGYTSFEASGPTFNAHTSYIFPNVIQHDATINGGTYQGNLVNTLVHEWEHSWWSPWDDVINPVPEQLGDQAEILFEQDGGINADCWVRPPHNGNLGGNK